MFVYGFQDRVSTWHEYKFEKKSDERNGVYQLASHSGGGGLIAFHEDDKSISAAFSFIQCDGGYGDTPTVTNIAARHPAENTDVVPRVSEDLEPAQATFRTKDTIYAHHFRLNTRRQGSLSNCSQAAASRDLSNQDVQAILGAD
jgi:hypothetical protein